GVSAAIVLAATVVVAPAGQASAESLRQALAAAYKFNPRLDAERARLRATDEEVPRARSGYMPQVFGSADAGYQHQRTRGGGVTDNRETHPRGYGVDLSQPIFSGFRTLNSVREAESTVRAGRANL